ncbi:MAG: hypothetical protein ABIN91_00890 [Mucilaginibacter sp.]|uniref:hypothetical protein n=1 Tax=Mucilaginibacter sp. TaxID=1882438 RepID=UPI003264B087
MAKSITAIILTLYFLAGSVLLPLSDFSLIKDLPGMYRSYSKIKAGSPDVIDFVGDYLLGGKSILGHNANDDTSKAGGALQFQHQANMLLYFVPQVCQLQASLLQPIAEHPIHSHTFHTFNYQNKLFRPPIMLA